MTQSESLLAQGKSFKLSRTKRSTAMPVLYPHGLGKVPVHKAHAADVTRQRHPCVTNNVFGTSASSWAPGTHTHTHTPGELNSKTGEGKLFGQSETTRSVPDMAMRNSTKHELISSEALAHGTSMNRSFWQRQRHLRRARFLPSPTLNQKRKLSIHGKSG